MYPVFKWENASIFVKEQLGNHHKHEDRTLSIKVRSIDEEEVAAAVPEESRYMTTIVVLMDEKGY